MGWGIAAAIVLSLVVAFVLYRMRGSRASLGEPRRPYRPARPPRYPIGVTQAPVLRNDRAPAVGSAAETDEFGVLLNMVLGDRPKAERLVAYERTREPNASRSRWIANAIVRMRDDQRR